MSKFIIIVAAAPALFFGAPAFAQTAPAVPMPVGAGAPAPATINLGSLGKVDAAGQPRGFDGPHGAATDLRDAPRPSDDGSTARTVPSRYNQLLGRAPEASAAQGHVKVFNGATGSELSSAPAATRRPGFDGPHGSATDLTDTPREPQTARRATLYGRKAGDDKRADAQPAPSPARGLTKAGVGTLTYGNGGTSAVRAQSQNNIRAMGTANAPR